MKEKYILLISFLLCTYSLNSLAQEGNLVPVSNIIRANSSHPICGSYEFLEKAGNTGNSHLKDYSNQLLEDVSQIVSNKNNSRAENDIYSIPVVFHVVYNNESENLPDSVIYNQLEILNECFRRQNANAIETRPVFQELVGDSKIEFRLANLDPNGLPSNGITRTSTSIEYFGGLLTYGPGQNSEIIQWVNDSLLYNFFRLTATNLGGHDPWDTERYLNIWIGDLRIMEPEFDDFEELIYFALATPPVDHVNWPANVVGQANDFEQGVLMHYVNVGNNNPNLFPSPYTGFNGVTNTGKMLVHEVGHYLGLRHIWGDGNCNFDDYIDDTPNSFAESAWDCNFNANSCLDNILDDDLPNMVENYMDYSSGDCQNSFTVGQNELMRAVLEEYRPMVFESIPASISNLNANSSIKYYPNPSSGKLFIDFESIQNEINISIQNSLGQIAFKKELRFVNSAELEFDLPNGIYFLRIDFNNGHETIDKLLIKKR